MKNGNHNHTPVNVAAINRSLHRHGESVGHGQLVDRQMPAYFDGNHLHLFDDCSGSTPVLTMPLHGPDYVRTFNNTAAINRSLALHGESI
jgi:hypothetical protein